MQHESTSPPCATNPSGSAVRVEIFVSAHCANCQYAYEIAALIREEFPTVKLRIVDLAAEEAEIPESVFATPTYLLDGRLWSLGNPSPQQARSMLGSLINQPDEVE